MLAWDAPGEECIAARRGRIALEDIFLGAAAENIIARATSL